MSKNNTKNTPDNKSENVSQEEVAAKAVEEPRAEETASSAQQFSVLSNADSEVAGLAKSQPDLEKMEALYTRTRGRVDLLALPEECEEVHKDKYRFKWLAKDKNLSAKLRVGPWVLCTRTSAPFIKDHRFGSHGAVEQAGMLLAFTTERLARVRERMSEERSKGLLKHYTEDITKKDGFYKPQDSGSDEDDESSYVEGRDF